MRRVAALVGEVGELIFGCTVYMNRINTSQSIFNVIKYVRISNPSHV